MPYKKKRQLHIIQLELKDHINSKDKNKSTLLESKRQCILVKLYKTHFDVRQCQVQLSDWVSVSVKWDWVWLPTYHMGIQSILGSAEAYSPCFSSCQVSSISNIAGLSLAISHMVFSIFFYGTHYPTSISPNIE